MLAIVLTRVQVVDNVQSNIATLVTTVYSARARVSSDAALWAARLYTNVPVTLKASEVIDGIELDKSSRGGLTPQAIAS